MKKRLLLIVHCLLLCFQLHAKKSAKAPAVPLKIGHTNLDYLMSCLPAAKQAASTLESFEKQLEQRLYAELGKLRQKEQAFQKGYETMTEAARNQKVAELQQLEVNLQQMQQDSRYQLVTKKENLYQPLYEEVQTAIEQVKQAHQYTHVFNTSMGGMPILLCADEEYDITDVVLKQLGVTPPKKEEAPKRQNKRKAKPAAKKKK